MTCRSGKKSYRSATEAHGALRRCRNNTGHRRRQRKERDAYRCPHCHEWHLTSYENDDYEHRRKAK